MASPPQASPTGPPGGGPGADRGAVSTSQEACTVRVERVPTSRTTIPVKTLKKRAEFLAARQGSRWSTPNFVVEAVRRPSPGDPAGAASARFGFTVSKKVGGAVERNRIKRRLRAVVAHLQGAHARADFDYVLIARRPALTAPFPQLLADFATAMDRVVTKGSHAGGKPRPSRKQG